MNRIKFTFLGVLMVGMAGFAGYRPVWAVVRPAMVPPPGTWQLDFELHGDPQQITVTLPGDSQSRRFWYLLYTVTNNTGLEVEFYPRFTLFTNTLKLSDAGVGVRKPVFLEIRKLYDKTIPLLEPEDMVTGPILVGQDNARDSVAIFEDFDPNAVWAKIFVSGLSNETVAVDLPTIETQQKKQILLRKTLMLEYQVPGDRYNPQQRVMLYRNRQWIMR
jgi:hypothetical protein